jgi:RNA-directed DNA polymerase
VTGHSLARESSQTGLDRIGLRAKAYPDAVFNNVGYAITEWLLFESFSALSSRKAVGIDKVTKDMYELNLSSNISNLLKKIRKGTYRPKPVRIVEIPKEDGSTRPLAISCLEDKIVQMAIAQILTQIYEPMFLPCSYGFRPERNCHQALRALNAATYAFRDGAVVEIDIRKCFNMIPHEPLMNILKTKITDSRFLNLIETLITVPILKDGEAIPTTRGCPQGSIVSPILANIFLHHAIDVWFTEIKRSHLKERAELIRYADDMVFVFESSHDAARVWKVLGKRLNKYGLEIHENKSRILESGGQAAKRAEKTGKRMPTYQFLGFTCYWGKTKKGFWRLKLKSRADRFTRALKGVRMHLRDNLNVGNVEMALKGVVRRVKGWINYHAISDNHRRVSSFLSEVKISIYKWFNRKGNNRSLKWRDLPHWLKQINFPLRYKTIPMW